MLLERKGNVMRDALDEQIEAYDKLLPGIKDQVGSAWVIVAEKRFVKAFERLADAVAYADRQYGERPVLIRHTDERKIESAPFLHVR